MILLQQIMKMMTMKMNMIAKIKQLIHVHDNDNEEDYFLTMKDDEWVKITHEEYEKMFRGNKK